MALYMTMEAAMEADISDCRFRLTATDSRQIDCLDRFNALTALQLDCTDHSTALTD